MALRKNENILLYVTGNILIYVTGKSKGCIFLDAGVLTMPSRFSINLMVPFIPRSWVHFQTDFPYILGKRTTASTSLSLGLWSKWKKDLFWCPHIREVLLVMLGHKPASGQIPGPVCWVPWLSIMEHVPTENRFREQRYWERRKLSLSSII